MHLDHYFQDELHRLRHLGGELASANPGLCRYLGHAGADPDVERLLEGAAFLTATLRARIDDQFPELSQGLLQLVAPQLLRIIPSLTLLQFQPIAHACHHPVWLAAGCEIDSEPLRTVAFSIGLSGMSARSSASMISRVITSCG